MEVNKIQRLYLGVKGENNARTIEIDVNAWFIMYPNATFSILHKRQGDETKYPTGATFDRDTGIISWMPTSADTFYAGLGTAEIRMTEGTVIKKTRDVQTVTADSLMNGSGETIASEWQAYINAIEAIKSGAEAAEGAAEDAADEAGESAADAGESAESAAESLEKVLEALDKVPRISMQSGNWMLWDVENEVWIDTGVQARGPRGLEGLDGKTPNIGIGIVETLEDGEQATASISGTALEPRLNLGLPKGEPGRDAAVIELGAMEYAFQVNSEGHLILYYGGMEAPNFSINEQGHLIYTF